MYVKNRNEKLATAVANFSLRFFTLIFPGTGCFSFYIYVCICRFKNDLFPCVFYMFAEIFLKPKR